MLSPGRSRRRARLAPAIFVDVPRVSPLAREEHFSPILTVFRAATFDEALETANDSEFALTAGVFSRSPAHITRARSELAAGNIYINRGITGALVGRHPFGGHKMSGAGTKAGWARLSAALHGSVFRCRKRHAPRLRARDGWRVAADRSARPAPPVAAARTRCNRLASDGELPRLSIIARDDLPASAHHRCLHAHLLDKPSRRTSAARG